MKTLGAGWRESDKSIPRTGSEFGDVGWASRGSFHQAQATFPVFSFPFRGAHRMLPLWLLPSYEAGCGQGVAPRWNAAPAPGKFAAAFVWFGDTTRGRCRPSWENRQLFERTN
jgi:hypothetical protein